MHHKIGCNFFLFMENYPLKIKKEIKIWIRNIRSKIKLDLLKTNGIKNQFNCHKQTSPLTTILIKNFIKINYKICCHFCQQICCIKKKLRIKTDNPLNKTEIENIHRKLMVKKKKKKTNKIINANNTKIGSLRLDKIIAHCKPRYIYGKIKIYKHRALLHPIIVKIPLSICNISKTTRLLNHTYLLKTP